MADFFGLRKEMDPKASAADLSPSQAVENPPPKSRSDSKRFWAILLVLDTVFLLVFGGALAGMLYIRWMKPGRRPATTAKAASKSSRAVPKRAEPAPKRAESAPKPAEKPAPRSGTETGRGKGPVGSPSVLAPDLPRRTA